MELVAREIFEATACIHRMMKLCLVFLFLCLVLEAVQSALISQSAISQCNHGDESEPSSDGGKPCETKFLVSVALKSGQVK